MILLDLDSVIEALDVLQVERAYVEGVDGVPKSSLDQPLLRRIDKACRTLTAKILEVVEASE